MSKRAIYIISFILVLFGVVTNASARLFASSETKQPDTEIVDVQKEQIIPDRLKISDLGIDVAVKKAEIVDGFWEVFEDTAAWGDQSGYPGMNGNQVIFAHAREGLFLPLKQVKKDMLISVNAGGVEYKYKVVDFKEVWPNDISVVAPTTDETLTLYTCTDYQDSKRLVVVAKRI